MIAILFLLLWLGVCGYSIWRGGQPERWVAVIFLAAVPLGAVGYSTHWRWRGIELGIFAVDVAMLIVLVVIALRANRYWTIGIAAMQVLQVTGHLLQLADPRMLPLLYWIGNVVWAYPMLILLWLGTLRHHNRERSSGPESSWSGSSNPSAATAPRLPID